jgi:hypothetical protein
LNQKLFFLVIILAIGAVALFVRARNRRLRGEVPAVTAASEPAAPSPRAAASASARHR